MEELNIEGLNYLIKFYSVVGVFVLIACCMCIIWFTVKVLQWSYNECADYCEKSNKELIKETIKEIEKNGK